MKSEYLYKPKVQQSLLASFSFMQKLQWWEGPLGRKKLKQLKLESSLRAQQSHEGGSMRYDYPDSSSLIERHGTADFSKILCALHALTKQFTQCEQVAMVSYIHTHFLQAVY